MKVGVLFTNLGVSQLAYTFIKTTNDLLTARSDVDVVAFYEELARPCLPCNFAMMQMNEAWSHNGTLVATNLSTAEKLMRFPSAKKKFFFLNDLEWTRGIYQYESIAPIYQSLDLICRSEAHQRLVEDSWGKDSLVMSDLSIENLMSHCHTANKIGSV